MPHGPHATATIPPLPRARRRVLTALADIFDGKPVLLTDIAERVGGHPNTSRQQLDQLVADGLVESEPVARIGRGRRPLGFKPTSAGRQALTGSGAQAEHTELLRAFAGYLVTKPDAAEEARAVGELWGHELALPPTPDEMAAVIELLEILGFDPAHATTDQGEAVLLRACPLLDLAHSDPEVVCEVHRGMIEGVLAKVGANRGVELRPFACEEGCHLIVTDQPAE
ncbi:helix-turn-helix transcriptional regulator [Enemella sp. A6]|uniref:helix-turn-helix transcriptional regulator n=1 Tax=Enemella sp. A6 TaxID=3440152 RepID=UPI003EBA6FF2